MSDSDDMIKLIAKAAADREAYLEALGFEELGRIGVALNNLQRRKESLEAEAKEIGDILTAMQRDILPGALAEYNIESIAFKGMTVSAEAVMQIGLPKAKQPKGFKWLRDNGHGAIITTELKLPVDLDTPADDAEGNEETTPLQNITDRLDEAGFTDYVFVETVHAARLKAWAKEMNEKGVTLPDDVFSISAYTWAKITINDD